MYADDAARARAHQRLEDARDHRERGDEAARVQALHEAIEAATELGDGPLLAASCWRLAKARYDLDQPGLVDALAPLVERDVEERGVWGIKHAVGPFDHYIAGLRALPPLSRRHWDREGYGSDALTDLWRAYIAWYELREDPFLAAWGRIHLAWHLACRGEIDEVRSLAHRYARQSPTNFGIGEHVHPRATEPHTSVYWVQLDLSRTWLRAATWAGAERSAWEAREHLEDAAEDSGLTRAEDFWFLDAIVQAQHRFGWTDVDGTYGSSMVTHTLGDGIPAFHKARARGLAAQMTGKHDDATQALQQAWELGQTSAPGPEWLVDVARQLTALEQPYDERGRALAERTGVRW